MNLLLIGFALAQGSPAALAKEDTPIPAPILTAGSHAAFQKTFFSVEEKLAEGDFASAGRLLRLLPKLSFTLAWDDAKLPKPLKTSFALARDTAINKWRTRYPGCEIQVVAYKKGMQPAPGALVSFVESIPPKAEDPLPPGAVHFFSEDPEEPRLETVISLTRGKPSVATDYVDVHNEVAYTISQYYGIERTIAFGSFSSRTDLPAASGVNPGLSDLSQAKENTTAVTKLATAIQKKQKMVVGLPAIHIDPLEIDAGEAKQGDLVKLQIQITNNGTGGLHVKAYPDCSCVSVMRGGMLAPGETRVFPAQIDLTDVVGDFDKSILVYSNDSENTVTRIPVRVKSKPVYRLLAESDGFVLMKKGGVKHKVYLVLPEGTSMTPKSARFEGTEAKVTFKPWKGDLEDPDLKEPALPRKGYVFEVYIPDRIPPGLTVGNLFIETDHPKFKELQANLNIQSGILALPDRILYGEIPAAPRRTLFSLSRPGHSFKVIDISVDSPFFKVVPVSNKSEWDYRYHVLYDGKALTGPLSATVTIKTNDPSQSMIKVPISATIR